MQRWLDLEKIRAADANPPWIGEITPKRPKTCGISGTRLEFRRLDDTERQRRREDRRGPIGAMCPCWLMGTYYFAYSTALLEQIATLLQQEEDAAMYPCTL